jgi:type IV secretory pathway TrbD component
MGTGTSPRAISILSGVLISAAPFMLLLWALAWFMPRFIHFSDTRSAKLLPGIAFFFIIAAGGVIRSRRSRQGHL